jgi:very-short-patch-repair endonuclease
MKRNTIIPYEPQLKERARELRKKATVAERLLWQEIRGKRLGVEFHRQVPIDRFIVDFYCHELLLAIEIDGITHNSEAAYKRDLERQAKIEAFGVSSLRFFDHDVRENLSGVVSRIKNWIEERNIPPDPLRRGESGQLFQK